MFLASLLLTSFLAAAKDGNNAPLETCYNHGKVLEINNEQVEGWTDSTPNGFHDRGHISGTILKVFPSSASHTHVSVQIGATEEDSIEVVYANSFGPLPALIPGSTLEACGDYITSFKSYGGEPASPDRGIIHWVHASNTDNHDAGFVIIDNVVYGNL